MARVFIFNMVQYWCVWLTSSCCFEPETSDIYNSIAHVQRQLHPRRNLTAANTPNASESKQDPIHLAGHCDRIARQSWELYFKTAWKYSFPFVGAISFFSHLKQNYPSFYLRSIAWTFKLLHDICSPCHHIERQPCGIDHNKSTTEWNKRCEAIPLVAAQQRFQPLAKLNRRPKLTEKPHATTDVHHVGFLYTDGFRILQRHSSGGSQIWCRPSQPHGVGWHIFVRTIGCTPKAPLERKLKYMLKSQ